VADDDDEEEEDGCTEIGRSSSTFGLKLHGCFSLHCTFVTLYFDQRRRKIAHLCFSKYWSAAALALHFAWLEIWLWRGK
jgi:hypothetical protein